MNKDNLHTVNLFEWTGQDGIKFTRTEDELREVFLNEDKAMRYLHENGFFVESFDPRDIDLVDGSKNCIRFNKFSRIQNSYEKDSITNSDIFISACLQIGLYTHTLASLNDQYLKDNYDEFAQYLPSGDVPYYRGVIQRNAGVYLCDFAVEKRNRDYRDLQKELAGDEKNIQFDEPAPVSDDELTNKQINDVIYSDLIAKQKTKGISDFAFVHVLVLPTIILTIGILICILSYVLNIFG